MSIVLTAVGSLAVVLLTLFAGAAPASAATPSRPHGKLTSAFQYRDGSIRVRGYAYDSSHPGASVRVCIARRGSCVRTVTANHASTSFNRSARIGGRHAFTVLLRHQRRGGVLNLRSVSGGSHYLTHAWVSTPGSRVVKIAKRFVGHRYTYGGASPRTGFDCSGLAMYSYAHARVAHLPHNAEAQRHARHMHAIKRSKARPGDLVFYMSGGGAYHVAIYAGHGKQVSAANPAQGIRYQRIWAHNVQFRTDWH
ncbi:MAG TPA: C40 family peptidase [Jatrophihabitantaceae bacterium]